MILIDDVLISDELIEEEFVCDLHACKGVCCVQGEAGAPLLEEEKAILADSYPRVRKYLTKEGRELIESDGLFILDDDGKAATPLIGKGGPCVYYFIDKQGISKCGIEQAHIDGRIDFQKPVSCHLYPIRISGDNHLSLVNYDRWDICSPACALGSKLKVPVYKFLKSAIIRRFGADFYLTLEKAVGYQNEMYPDAVDKFLSSP